MLGIIRLKFINYWTTGSIWMNCMNRIIRIVRFHFNMENKILFNKSDRKWNANNRTFNILQLVDCNWCAQRLIGWSFPTLYQPWQSTLIQQLATKTDTWHKLGSVQCCSNRCSQNRTGQLMAALFLDYTLGWLSALKNKPS